ncbi:DUF1249 domain-containing protein [Marinagarivorans cellulosilyticus]|uniref:DUF1249 domain-containing protein n=1 Tax=Marinagarivorans cellulosilyticus TaxID=2721545 RepID=A0AAN1WJL5_9GAMM|nr:DUF1249 domain-containing protein [Marinagarivorans cellulosilyticus]BCD98782.1 hypothetical protein MARGE09_P2983 [Marinagarivorans cellulosilyticus]
MVAFNRSELCDYIVNLKRHHSQCELNYHLCMSLIPDCRQSAERWSFELPSERSVSVLVSRVDLAPYTTTLEITQSSAQSDYVTRPRMLIRLYHDVEMAEVVAWDNHRHWHPVYSYPNRKMYQRDEKLALNRFLGEWLVHCRKLGISPEGFVNPLP